MLKIFVAIVAIVLVILLIIFSFRLFGNERKVPQGDKVLRLFWVTRSSSNALDEYSEYERSYFLKGSSNQLTIRITDPGKGNSFEKKINLTDEEYKKIESDLLSIIETFSLQEWGNQKSETTEYFATDQSSSSKVSYAFYGEDEVSWNDTQETPDNYSEFIKFIDEYFERYY